MGGWRGIHQAWVQSIKFKYSWFATSLSILNVLTFSKYHCCSSSLCMIPFCPPSFVLHRFPPSFVIHLSPFAAAATSNLDRGVGCVALPRKRPDQCLHNHSSSNQSPVPKENKNILLLLLLQVTRQQLRVKSVPSQPVLPHAPTRSHHNNYLFNKKKKTFPHEFYFLSGS
jgi:hypothetical protein